MHFYTVFIYYTLLCYKHNDLFKQRSKTNKEPKLIIIIIIIIIIMLIIMMIIIISKNKNSVQKLEVIKSPLVLFVK